MTTELHELMQSVDYEAYDLYWKWESPDGESGWVQIDSGNAFRVMAAWKQAAKNAGMSYERRKEILAEATTGDYEHLVKTLAEYFMVSVTTPRVPVDIRTAGEIERTHDPAGDSFIINVES